MITNCSPWLTLTPLAYHVFTAATVPRSCKKTHLGTMEITNTCKHCQKYDTYSDHNIHLQEVEAFLLGQKKYIPFQDWAVQLSLGVPMAVMEVVVVQFCVVDMGMCLWWEL